MATTTGETWVLNETLDMNGLGKTTIAFTSNNENFVALVYSMSTMGPQTLWYYTNDTEYIVACEYGTWQNQAYRTLTFATAPSGDLLTWLQANGVKQSSKLSVDLTTLSGWSNLSSGSHTIKLVAKGSGYRDSEKSEGVSVTKAAETVTLEAGAYIFNGTLTLTSIDQSIEFTSNSQSFTRILRQYDNRPTPNVNQMLYYKSDNTYELSYGLVSDTVADWTDTAYQTITLSTDQQVSQEFYNWFTANANKVYTLEAGTYKWKDSPSFPDDTLWGYTQTLSFTTNNVQCTSIEPMYTGGAHSAVYYGPVGSVYTYSWSQEGETGGGWDNDAYKTITLTTSQTVSADFYNWAITQGNLVKQVPSVTFTEGTFSECPQVSSSAAILQAYDGFNNTTGTFIEKLTAATSSDTVTALLTASGYTEAEANAKLGVSVFGDISVVDGSFACTSSASAVYVLVYNNGSWIVKITTKSGTTFSGNTGLLGRATVPIIVIVA